MLQKMQYKNHNTPHTHYETHLVHTFALRLPTRRRHICTINNATTTNSTIIRPPTCRRQLPSSPPQPLLPNSRPLKLRPRLRAQRRRTPPMPLLSLRPLHSPWVRLAVEWQRALALIMHSIIIIIISWKWARNVPPRTMTCYNWYLFFYFFTLCCFCFSFHLT